MAADHFTHAHKQMAATHSGHSPAEWTGSQVTVSWVIAERRPHSAAVQVTVANDKNSAGADL